MRSPASPQIHQNLIKIQNNSYKEPLGDRHYYGSEEKASACNAADLGLISDQEDALVKGMATHSGILAWGIPWTEETGRL